MKSGVPPESFVAQEDPEVGQAGAVAGQVDNLGPVALLVVELNGQLLQLLAHCSQECPDIVKPHGDQVQLHKVLQTKQGSPDYPVRVVQHGNLVVDDKVELPQLGTSVHHQLHVILDLTPFA